MFVKLIERCYIQTNLLGSMNNSSDTIRSSFGKHAEVFRKSADGLIIDIEKGLAMLTDLIKNDQHLFVCGNGGSAADAQHFAAEWVCKYSIDRKPLKATALTVNSSSLTAIGNDYGFSSIFSRQLEAVARANDLLVAISTSGTSPNIIEAIKKAKSLGVKVIALTGEKGRGLIDLADLAIVVPSSETARIQEVHEFIYHVWCECIDSILFSK